MDAGLGKQTGDIVSAKKGSAAEEYYRYMLLKEKLAVLKDSESNPLLKVQSEREAIEMSILGNLISITESSPEFSQVVDITGSRDRYEQARILSEVVYDKARAEQILSWYVPSVDSLKGHFKSRIDQTTKARAGGSTIMTETLNKLSELSAVPNFLASFTGSK